VSIRDFDTGEDLGTTTLDAEDRFTYTDTSPGRKIIVTVDGEQWVGPFIPGLWAVGT